VLSGSAREGYIGCSPTHLNPKSGGA
jgi:hypothetical protein